MSKKSTGQIVREARTAKGLSREALAVEVNVSVSTIVRLENHDATPAFRTAVRIARLLGVALDELAQEDSA